MNAARTNFASTLTTEQLPFILSRLANAKVRRMVAQNGIDGTIKMLESNERQKRAFLKIVDEEFDLLPSHADIKVGAWVQFTEPRHHRIIVGKVKKVLPAGVKVKEYTDQGQRQGWAPTGSDWTVAPDLDNGFIEVSPKKVIQEAKPSTEAASSPAPEAAAS